MIARRINHLWRLLMTVVCFALFGLGGLLLSLCWFNLLLLVIRDDDKRRRLARRSISASFRAFGVRQHHGRPALPCTGR